MIRVIWIEGTRNTVDTKTGETETIRLPWWIPHSRLEHSNICVWRRLREHRKYLRSIGLSGRLKNLYKIHSETKYANTPVYPVYARIEKSRKKKS